MRVSVAVTAASLILLTVPAVAQVPRLLDAGAVTERDDHLDLALSFGCSLRYQGHGPASEGDRLTVRLHPGADCGLSPAAQFPVERQMIADSRNLVRSIELQPSMTGGVELSIQWNRVEKFVLAPTAGMRGLRVRVPRRPAVQVVVGDLLGPGSYAVNLASAAQRYSEVDIAKAAALLRAPVFVSQLESEGQTWFRLRAGPFDVRREAERILREARQEYPAAWLAIEDEQDPEALVTEQSVLEPASASSSRAAETRTDPVLDRILTEARTSMAAKRYDDVVMRLTPILLEQDYVHRVDATEMLGLARERKGQLTQAKAVYEDFLRRYPRAKSADRVRQRLQALRTASLPGQRGSGANAADREGWSILTNVAQIYRRDDFKLATPQLSRNIVTQNALLNDFDTVIRHRGERRDFIARSSFGYQKDLLTNGPGDQVRVSTAYAEWNDREWGLGARLGRQSRGMAGVNGSFDGLYGNWQWRPNMALSLTAGLPVESSRAGPETERQFLGAAIDLATSDRRWETAFFVLAQQYTGEADRRSIGVETRYLRPGRTMVVMTDYDIHFSELNSIMFLGTLITESRWTFNLDAGRQRSPQLSLRNALIGQPTLAFDDLQLQFNAAELEQIALDRSAQLTQFNLNASRPLGETAQWTVNLGSTDLTGTKASGGVEAVPATGREDSLTSELLLNSLFRAGDLNAIALRYQQSDAGSLASLGISNRMPLGSAVRLTSRLRMDRRTQELNDTQAWTLLPSVRFDYLRGRNQFEFEAGAELGRTDRSTLEERSTRYFVSLGYRLSMDWGRR